MQVRLLIEPGEQFMKVRVKFSKHGVLKYIGHLDLMRYFQKAFRRTDINVSYSKGFSPHMIMSFAQPLGVGVESDGEYFDVEVSDDEDVSLFVSKLNPQMAEGIRVLDCVKLPDNTMNAMASVAAADVKISFYKDNPLSEELIDKFKSCDEVLYIKKTKTGEKEINVKDFVFDISLISESELYARLDASSSGNLKPAVLCESLLKLEGKNISDFPFHITRLDTLKRNDEGQFVPLNQL
jgi:radical SAM-linked protein